MDFDVETLGPCRKKVVVTIPADRVDAVFDEKYDEINDAVAMPGFRPGHAPRKLLERRFATRLAEELRGDLVKEALDEIFEDEALKPLTPPDVDVEAMELEPGEPLVFEFELVTRPEFETPTYQGLEVAVPPIEVSDEDVDEAVDRLRRRNASLETVEDGEVQEDDILIVDWKALEGDSVEARDNSAYYPYGRGVLAGFVTPTLDEQLQGKRAGATATETVEVAADDPREELRGRELTLEVVLKAVRRYVLPPIDEKFLEKHDYDDEKELREDVARQIERAMSRHRDGYAQGKLVEQLVDGIEISLPDGFVEKELENWAARKRMSLQMEQVEEEEIARRIDADRADTAAAIERDMKRHFLLERIADEESIEATEDEVIRAIHEMAEAYGHPVEQVAAQFRDRGRMAELQSQIRQRKAAEAIRATADLVEDPSLADDDGPAEDDGEAAEASTKPAAKKKKAKKKSPKKAAE